MTLITVVALFVNKNMVETRKNTKTPQTVKWSSLLILFRGKKDNGGMHSRETLSTQNKNLVWVTKI